MAPSFWQVAGSAYRASTAHSFLLHGDGTQDYVDGSADLVPWLKQALIKSEFDLVIEYDPANGLQFPVPSMRQLFLKEVMGAQQQQNAAYAAMTGQTAQQDVDLRLSLVEALPLLDKALSLSQRPNPEMKNRSNYRVSVIFSMADLTFPAMTIGPLPPSLAQANAYILSWLRNPVWRAANAPMIWFVAPTLSGVADVLRGAYTIAVSAPNYDERKAFAEQSLKANEVRLADGLTLHRLASMTAGLLRLHIEDVIVKARIESVPLTPALVKARKDEIMQARFAGVLETVEATGSLDDIAGLDYLKDYLRSEIVQPMKDGETEGMPMGVLMAGPPGTGKTYIAEKLAASAGVNFVMLRMSNILGGIVGQSEANLEKALSGIQEMTPCIVFIDEVEQQVRRDTGAGGSPVAGNLFGRLLNAMGDTRNRGRVVWLMATNRPDLLDAAFKRSGRIDGKFAVMPPDNNQERAEMFRVMARKNGVTLADDVRLDEIVPACEDYTGADVEVIVNKARKVAREHGRIDVTHEDLAYAVKMIRVSASGETKRMIALALAEVNDWDNLPPSYRERALAGEFEEQPAAATQEPEVITGRTGRAFDFEA